MAEDGEIVREVFEEEGESSGDDDYFVAGDFDENDALTNGVMMGLDWESVKQMMYNGYGHLLAQGYPSPESYLEHMREKEKQEKLLQSNKQGQTTQTPPPLMAAVSEFSAFPASQLHFPPLNAAMQLPYNPMVQLQPTMPGSFRGGRGRGRGGNRGGGRGAPRSFRGKPRKRKGSGPKKDADHMNLANEDCRFYLAGTCSKGIECTYRHCAEAKNTSAICESWQETSKCADTQKCKSLHPTKQADSKLCHFFIRGVCKNGSGCKFLHAEPEKSEDNETKQSEDTPEKTDSNSQDHK